MLTAKHITFFVSSALMPSKLYKQFIMVCSEEILYFQAFQNALINRPTYKKKL